MKQNFQGFVREEEPGVAGTENEPVIARRETVIDVLNEIRFGQRRW